jgi:hypothetical protein
MGLFWCKQDGPASTPGESQQRGNREPNGRSKAAAKRIDVARNWRHYRKLRPDASKAVSINDTWRGRRVNRLPSHHREMTGIENERRPDGSSPRRARSLDEKACFCLRKSVSARRARRARYGATKRLSRAPFVSMVQATRLRNRNDTTVLRSVYGSRLRGIFR